MKQTTLYLHMMSLHLMQSIIAVQNTTTIIRPETINNRSFENEETLLHQTVKKSQNERRNINQFEFDLTVNNASEIEKLLQCGADPRIKNSNGDTPLHIEPLALSVIITQTPYELIESLYASKKRELAKKKHTLLLIVLNTMYHEHTEERKYKTTFSLDILGHIYSYMPEEIWHSKLIRAAFPHMPSKKSLRALLPLCYPIACKNYIHFFTDTAHQQTKVISLVSEGIFDLRIEETTALLSSKNNNHKSVITLFTKSLGKQFINSQPTTIDDLCSNGTTDIRGAVQRDLSRNGIIPQTSPLYRLN